MLSDLAYSYNHSVKTKPANVTVENEKQVWHTLYDDHDSVKHIKVLFSAG